MSAKVLVLAVALFAAQFSGAASAVDHPGQMHDDSQIVSSVKDHKGAFYVEGANLIVTKVLPDDTNGLPHQLWNAKLSDGSVIQVVYNSDMGERVPMQVGDSFSAGGQLLWLGNHALLHWVHDDPKHKRPDGYIYFNGVTYGDTDHEDSSSH